jgi:hypothetical protein
VMRVLAWRWVCIIVISDLRLRQGSHGKGE